MTDSSLPEVIGGYELVRSLGRGGMAEVWVARKQVGAKGSKYVALKLIAEHFLGDPRYTKMFRAEAELAAALNHANIVQLFEHGEDAGRSYLVMEWVDGLNLLKLEEKLAYVDERRRFRVASYIIGQLLHALHYAHRIRSADGHPLGVVHRDVSPQNVLVSNNGEVKLTDFGVAHHNFEESSGMYVKGKVRYMPPEQLTGKSRSPTVDLYAVGALLHEMLDGKKFRGVYEDGQDLFTVVLSGQVPLLSRKAPPELEALRRRLLERDPTRRIQTAEEALAALRRFPDYGDAREELAKLCGSATGVLIPCVAPQRSSPMTSAENATEPRRARAVLPPPPSPSPPPLPPVMSRGSNGPPTGATTAVRIRGGEEPPGSCAWRTGHTEIIALETVHVHDAGASTEAQPSSRTDQEIVVPAVVGDGTVTAHELGRQGPSRTSPSRMRAALALAGLLVCVASISTAMTWWLVGRRHGDVESTLLVEPDPEEPGLAGSRPPMISAATGALVGGAPVHPVALAAAAESFEPPAGDTAEPSRSTPSARSRESAVKAPARKVEVKVAASSGLKTAQVRVARKVISVDSGPQKVSSGTRTIWWRRTPSDEWQRSVTHELRAGKRWVIHIGKNGPRVYEGR